MYLSMLEKKRRQGSQSSLTPTFWTIDHIGHLSRKRVQLLGHRPVVGADVLTTIF